MRILYSVGLIILFITPLCSLYAQQKKAIRYEIDAKREGIAYTAKDALPRGREFKRLDSTYYVGWMLEGCYRYEHAADYLGYKIAAEQLQRAIDLMVQDFSAQLQTRTQDVMTYIGLLQLHKDWDYTAYCLANAYSDMDAHEQLWKLLQTAQQLDLQDELYMETFHYKAWTVHRNRFKTASDIPFLRNSITANEQYAALLLDSSVQKIKRDAALNKHIFAFDYAQQKMPGVWHYLSILYSYQLNIPQAEIYYEKLKNTAYFPVNNYATFCAIQAKFKEAATYYELAQLQEGTDKRMKESYYYGAIMQVYANQHAKAIQTLQSLIKANGSTPGYGWYHIALSRSLQYGGQLQHALTQLNKAENFQEIHIGTTLGQSHYDFSIAINKLMLIEKQINRIKYWHKGWWFSPKALREIGKLTLNKYGLQFVIINQFSNNPERDQVMYKIFSTESTITFDEIWQLIDGFGTPFFIEKFNRNLETEKRPAVIRYYRWFLARLYMKQENYNKAITLLNNILQDKSIDATYEKLFLGQVYVAILQCQQAQDQQLNVEICKKLYQVYPQMIPYSGITFPIYVTHHAQTEQEKFYIQFLEQCNVSVTSAKQAAIQVNIDFNQMPQEQFITYEVKMGDTQLIPPTRFRYQDTYKTYYAQQLSLYIFAIQDIERKLIPVTSH